jgi:3-oxoacyl-(acyl-carrier-protein) synthase
VNPLIASSAPEVVVTGLGFITSIGNSAAEVTSSLRENRHGFEPVCFLDNPAIPVKLAGTIKGFEVDSPYYQKWRCPDEWHPPQDLLRGLAPHGLYAYCAIEQAIQDAGIERDQLRDPRTALFCASAGSTFLTCHHVHEMRDKKGMRGSPFGVVSTISGTLNFNFGAYYGIQGGNCGFVSACASSAHAIGFAIDQIQLGRVDRVIVVGAEEINAESVLPFSAMRALSNQSDPSLASCPFDRRRSGFVASGGAVALVLESAPLARQRGQSPYGKLLGWAQSSDGYNPAISDPAGNGIARAMELALAACQLSPSDIGYINAHATSTVQGDRSEVMAIRTVFGQQACHPWVSSTKALTGHPLSLAGAQETAICMLALKQEFIPAAAHLSDPIEEAAGMRFPSTHRETKPGIILKNSCGFGGSNATLILGPSC